MTGRTLLMAVVMAPIFLAVVPGGGRAGAPQIHGVVLSGDRAGLYEKIELTVDLAAEYANPYDPEQIDLRAEFRAPSGRTLTVPGFYHQQFIRVDEYPGKALDTDEWSWKIRFAPDEVGTWSYRVLLATPQGKAVSPEGRFEAVPSAKHGFIRTIRGKSPHFAFSDGTPYFAIGENLAWWKSSPSDYADWLRRLGENGANFIRIWMASWSFALEWEDTGLGVYDRRQERADHLDWVFDEAEKYGIRILLTLQNHGQFSARTNPEWSNNPFNRKNGGPLARPSDFFTDPKAKALAKQRYRYIVARWGYRSNLLAWELFNEVDLTDGYRSGPVAAWHREMAAYIESVDPFDHPVTTSFSSPQKDPAIWSLPEIDFTNTHFYNASDMAALVVEHDRSKLEAYGKPTFSAEFGTDWRGANERDAAGVNLHNALWASPFSGGTGTAMTWWWDNYIDPKDLYHHFGSLVSFLGDFDWLTADRTVFEPLVRTSETGDVMLPADAGWGERPDEVAFRVTEDGVVQRPRAIAQFLHGKRYNTRLRTAPIRLDVASQAPTRVGVRIQTAAKAGARLEMALDGEVKVVREFEPADRDRPVGETYWLDVPPGRHRVTIENTGTDWLQIAGYVLRGVTSKARALALAEGGRILVWVQDRVHIWSRIVEGYEPALIEGAEVVFEGVKDGAWEIELWDAWNGRPADTWTARASDGRLIVALPPFRRDVGLKMSPAE